MRSIRGTESRAVDFDLDASHDGRTLDGYAAVFNSRTRIPDNNGDFDEEIKPGAFRRSLKDNGTPTMQWDHGRDARVGTVPIGRWTSFVEDPKGYRVRGYLFDNPVVEPVRQAIADGAVTGLSFRFKVPKGGDKWERRSGGTDLRAVHDCDVHEAGPVAFPAYKEAKVNLRSLGGVGTVERHYEPEAEPSIAQVLRMLEEVNGISTDRIVDRLETARQRQVVDNRAHRDRLLSLARGEKRAKRDAALAYMAFSNGWGRRSEAMDNYVAANRRADELRAELFDGCLGDEELVSALRRRVAS